MLPSRKTSVVPLLLFCVLLTLFVLKVASVFRPVALLPQGSAPLAQAPGEITQDTNPSNVRVIAQLNPNPNSVFANATSIASTCGGPLPSPIPTDALAFCEQQSVDVTDYIAPQCGDVGGNCGTVTGSSVTLTDAFYGSVTNSVENLGNGTIKQNSNDIHFIYQSSGGSISLLQDTIWGGGPAGGFFTCDGTNEEAFYRVYSADGTLGNKQYPTTAQCGQINTSSSFLKTFKKKWDGKDINNPATGTSPLMPESELAACNVSEQTGITVTNTNRMIFQGKAKCNGVDFDMAAFLNVGGAGAEEVNMYCKGKGLCAFYQKIDFSLEANQPKNWVGKDICNLKDAGGSAASLPNYFEYNLQRACGQTPEKVMQNFLDEYSVTCVPETNYALEFVRREQCLRTSQGCAGWNTTGELKFVAGSRLFGLFRNEDAVNSRYNNRNAALNKNRQESIEAYLTGRPDRIPSYVQNNSNSPNITQLSMYQSPLYKNTTLEQQCVLIYNKLEAVKELCDPINRIEGEENSECAINQFLPNTSLRYVDLYNEIGNVNRCQSLMNPAPNNTQAIALRDQILNVDPAMEVGYRPAFLVVATFVGDPTQLNPRFLAQGQDKSRFWQVDYLEIKVPTFGSDFTDPKGAQASNKSRPGGSYKDPLRATADVLMTPELQEAYAKEEEDERTKIRGAAVQVMPSATGDLPNGWVLGATNAPIKCRSKTQPGVFSANDCDNIARALVSFINASGAFTPEPDSLHRQFSPVREWIPSINKCGVNEEDLYGNSVLTADPVDPQYRVAEEANTIGSKLESKAEVGLYKKKTEAITEIEANVRMTAGDGVGDPNVDNFGSTRIFFVSPHNYTLMYAQNAYMGLLTPEQQKLVLENANFNSVLKTKGLDSFSGDKVEETYLTMKGTGESGPPPIINSPEFADEYKVSTQLQREKPAGEEEEDSPLMWQTAGSVANFTTRLSALLTNPIGSKMYDFTLGCTGPYATEMWLQGRCTAVASNPNDPANPDPNAPVDPNAACVEVFVDESEAQAAATQLKRDLPGQQQRTSSFAGWAAYFSVTNRMQDQHLFRNDCDGGKSCINYILDRIVTETQINPYLAIAISLNETGGLISNEPDAVGPHFGCGVDRDRPGYISSNTIENKLECMMGFFARNSSLSSDEAMRLYGYKNGMRNDNINKIISYISKGQYDGTCE
jgi:hypothetical protein